MRRRAVVAGTLTALTAGCTDRIHDVAASTPGDVDVRSRFVDGDPLVASAGVTGRSADEETSVLSFTSADRAVADLGSGAEAARSFVADTDFADEGGRSVLLVTQRLTSPAVDLRLRAVNRTGGRSLRVGVDEVGTRNDADPAVKTLFVRVADERGPPERVTVSVENDRVAVTV
ncbi:hypothetical protein GRS48_01760 [Halorubrum sp. JWXQ-INN 858]|uniref:hypothetical protein n=1 Tax=Halorubrum sp. JWXQ-INN 858 TaxID=2690782 RepID=UPI001358A29D|nr:hypothetical protein [Halorubrum sp. JWXQ-INN 858]MWV63554.1 hypothetical protein [Halorubrum sp. JWXQ-INN 858]